MVRAPLVGLVCVVCALAAPARAQELEYAGRVPGTPLAIANAMHPLGDARYLSLAPAMFDARALTLFAVDVDARAVVTITTPVRPFLDQFWRRGDVLKPSVEVLLLAPRRVGLHVSDTLGEARRNWYVELDRKTGAIVRTIELGTFAGEVDFCFLATDLARGAVWFYYERYAKPRDAKSRRSAGPEELVVRRLDLATRAVADVVAVPLPARAMKSGYEDQLRAHASGDGLHFAFVEYDEDAFHTTPHAQVYFVDPYAGTAFAVPAFDTTYGVAFARDGHHAYLASHSHGTIARVNLGRQEIDRTIAGPKLVQRIAVSPSGGHLFVFCLGDSYTVYDLPKLDHRVDRKYPAELVAAGKQLFNDGGLSLDGATFLLGEALRGDAVRGTLLARLVD